MGVPRSSVDLRDHVVEAEGAPLDAAALWARPAARRRSMMRFGATMTSTSGMRGRSPSPQPMMLSHACHDAQRDRVERGGGDGRAAATAADGEERDAARVGRELGLALGRADEADRGRDDRGGFWRAGVDHLEQMEERGGCVADDDNRAREPVAPELDGRGGAGGAEPRGEIGHGGIVERDDAARGDAGMDAGGDHLAVAEDDLSLTKGVLDRLGQPRVADDVVREIDHAAGVDHADGDCVQVHRADARGRPRRGWSRSSARRSHRGRGDSRAPPSLVRAPRRASLPCTFGSVTGPSGCVGERVRVVVVVVRVGGVPGGWGCG